MNALPFEQTLMDKCSIRSYKIVTLLHSKPLLRNKLEGMGFVFTNERRYK